jgi:hypothetical protein
MSSAKSTVVLAVSARAVSIDEGGVPSTSSDRGSLEHDVATSGTRSAHQIFWDMTASADDSSVDVFGES